MEYNCSNTAWSGYGWGEVFIVPADKNRSVYGKLPALPNSFVYRFQEARYDNFYHYVTSTVWFVRPINSLTLDRYPLCIADRIAGLTL